MSRRADPTQRLAYLDNLKIVLVAGVISVHVAITYGMSGSWYLQSYDRLENPLRALLTGVGAIGWLFGLGLFFLISGRLSSPSLDRKGPGRFMRDRLLRLGIPLLAYTLLVAPLLEYVSTRVDGGHQAFWPFVSNAVWSLDTGPTWFLAALLLFSAALALWQAIRPPRHREHPGTRNRNRSLRGRDIAVLAVAIAVLSFVMRFAFPLGSEQHHFQLSVFSQYAVLFALGVIAGRRGWLEALPADLVRRCGFAALATALVLPLLLLACGLFSGNKDAFEGGWHWQAIVGPLTEGILAPCACIWLLDLFRRRFDHQGALAMSLGDAAYGAFLVHPPVIVGLALAVHPLAVPAGLKFMAVLCAGIAASFGLAILFARVRPVAKVIGARSTPSPSLPIPRPAGSASG